MSDLLDRIESWVIMILIVLSYPFVLAFLAVYYILVGIVLGIYLLCCKLKPKSKSNQIKKAK